MGEKCCGTCKYIGIKDFVLGYCDLPGIGWKPVYPEDSCDKWEGKE